MKLTVPDGESGIWKISTFVVDKAGADFHNMRESMHRTGRYISEGTYKQLTRGGQVIMSNTPSEFRDHREFIREAKRSKSVLINGLGLGMCIEAILESDVEDITVIENSLDVIALAAAHYEKDPRVKVIHCSAFDYIPPKGLRYGAVWHDIWDNICADNLEEMSKLHRKYGRRTDWQGSWCKEQCKSYR